MASIVRPSTPVLETLEPRIVLSAVDGLPDLSDLETSTNPVVVLETDFGDIYIELFQDDAPVTVENFIQYTELGQYSESLFHRSVSGFVLQGGGFAFDADIGFQAVFDEDLGGLATEFARSNVERTVAMAKRADPDSATSQFFFNLGDNSSNLDGQDFTVFGRVITNTSWNAVLSISSQSVEDVRSDPAFEDPTVDRFGNPLFFDDDGFLTLVDTGMEADQTSAMGELPVNASFDGTFDDGDQIEIVNAQIVKPADSDFFFNQVVAIPEGFRSQRAADFLELSNPNSGTVDVQVIVRYEDGLRDRTIFSGTMDGTSSMSLTLHDRLNGATPLVRAFNPYAVEVFTSAAPAGVGTGTTDDDGLIPVSATMTRFDYGGFASEGFANFSDSDNRSLTWDFSSVPVGSTDETYIVWQNLSDTETEITVSFIGDGFTPFNQNFNLEAYRRGGVSLNEISALDDMPEGTLVGVRVTATSDIAAAISTFQTDTGLPVDDGQAAMNLGTPFQGRVKGVLPAARIPAGGAGILTALNANNTAAVIQLIARTAAGDTFSATPVPFIMTAQSRATIDLATVFPLIPADEPFSISYTSTTPVSLDYSSSGPAGLIEDILSEPVQIRAATMAHFAGARISNTTSGSNTEIISIFNPYANQTISYDLSFHFSDGTSITVASRTLEARANVNHNLSDFTAVANKAASDPDFEILGVTVRGFEEFGLDARHLVAQLTRTDSRVVGERGEALSFIPTLDGEILPLDDSIFDNVVV